MSPIFLYFLIFSAAMSAVVCQFQGPIGVCNGRKGGNLPSEQDVVELYKSKGIKRMRIYAPLHDTLAALRGSDIELILDVPNVDLNSLQSDADATQWVRTNVAPYFPATKIKYIAVGNEVDPEKPEASGFVPQVLPAMQNIHAALQRLGFNQIKVSTASYPAVLDNTYPPSDSVFKDRSFMPPIVDFLAKAGSPLLFNIYPYFAFIGDKSGSIKLDFALFTSPRLEYVDEGSGLEYRNLFDAMVDGVYHAMEKVGGRGVGVVVSESGWPSAGGGAAVNVENANTYYRNLIKHVGGGTPKKQEALETYLFAMFDENEKPGETTEQHFGLFRPDKTPKYQL